VAVLLELVCDAVEALELLCEAVETAGEEDDVASELEEVPVSVDAVSVDAVSLDAVSLEEVVAFLAVV
jgi:hypothetical protein